MFVSDTGWKSHRESSCYHTYERVVVFEEGTTGAAINAWVDEEHTHWHQRFGCHVDGLKVTLTAAIDSGD